MYDLHIICGANESIGSPEYCADVLEDPLSYSPCKFRYSHVIFFVTQKDSSSAERYPLLFFAEFDNEEGEPLCCLVDVPTPFAGLLFFLHKFDVFHVIVSVSFNHVDNHEC